MPVLALDSTGGVHSVALLQDGKLIGSAVGDSSGRHSVTLLGAIREVLDGALVAPARLSAVAVTSGPGAFTALRVGIATSKGLASSCGIRLFGMSTLRVLASAIAEAAGSLPGDTICGLIEAGRGQLYRGVYRCVPATEDPAGVSRTGEESLVDPSSALGGLPERSWIGGPAAMARAEVLRRGGPPSLRWLEKALPLARVLAGIAEAAIRSGADPGVPLTPNYVREPDARPPVRG